MKVYVCILNAAEFKHISPRCCHVNVPVIEGNSVPLISELVVLLPNRSNGLKLTQDVLFPFRI